MSIRRFKVSVIGGGTGLPTVLKSLKNLALRNAIVNMVDDGRSSGILRNSYHFPAVGDLRNTLVALAENIELAESFSFRFSTGPLSPHPLGNVFLVGAAAGKSENFKKAINLAAGLLEINGKAIPVTYQLSTLKAETISGKRVTGQVRVSKIREGIKKVWITPPGLKANPEAVESLKSSDWIIIAPGSLYSSVLPVLLTGNIARVLRKIGAIKIIIINVANKHNEIKGMKASDYIKVINQHIGETYFNYIICHDHSSYPVKVEEEVEVELKKLNNYGEKIVVGDFADRENPGFHSTEKLRSFWLDVKNNQKGLS